MKRPQLFALLALGTGVLMVNLLRKEDPRRARVVSFAKSHVGSADSDAFWADALPTTPASQYPKDWCGAFALAAIHSADLAPGVHWGLTAARPGFLIPNLKIVSHPEPGDIAYFDKNQHHAVVESYDPATETVHLINGNGQNGVVSESSTKRQNVTAFFSLAPLLT